jgi:archaetidylinositol phosphate synthase
MRQGTSAGTRVNDSVLALWEKRALIALAGRMPAWVNPDQLTALGVAGAVLTFLAYILSQNHAAFLWIASLGIAINWFGDSLDGTLARVRKIERPRYGFFLDHTTDLLSQSLVALGLGLSPYVRFDIACLVLIAYLIAAAFTFVRRIVSGSLAIALLGVGPTEVRVGIVVLNTVMFFWPPFPVLSAPLELSSADVVILVAAAATLAAVLVAAAREWQQLRQEDPPPR